MGQLLPPIPAKRYFTIGETGLLCDVKPHVLRYWEQEFTQLKPMKRRGNRRYYQHHEVLMIRKIRSLLYDQGFTISGARNQLQELGSSERWHEVLAAEEGLPVADLKAVADEANHQDYLPSEFPEEANGYASDGTAIALAVQQLPTLRRELKEISRLLTLD
jgi:DNA-binding transcriptional MerR regulator